MNVSYGLMPYFYQFIDCEHFLWSDATLFFGYWLWPFLMVWCLIFISLLNMNISYGAKLTFISLLIMNISYDGMPYFLGLLSVIISKGVMSFFYCFYDWCLTLISLLIMNISYGAKSYFYPFIDHEHFLWCDALLFWVY